ncbi:MAG: beta-ketoacyl-ACP synthase II [Anaerolineae bacterium]|nr:beta-ketoacyl-ACP synthase II [Anaerolineae bacterium]
MTDRIRVVITGIGAVTPLGLTARETWDKLLAGISGIGPIQAFNPSHLPVRIAGEVKNFDPNRYIARKEARRMARCSQLAAAAAQMALADGSLSVPVADAERVGTVIGVGMGGLDWALHHSRKFWEQGLLGASPFALASSLPNMPSYHVSLLAGAMGPITTPVAACATGCQAIGEAMEMIRLGRADVMIAGGAEGLVHEIPIAGFAVMRALSQRNDEPERASRPFDKDRDGFVFAEGAGVVILERLEHALARGAHIYAEVAGYAFSSDAYHIAQPDPEGQGAQRAMRWALADAGVAPGDVDYVNAHGTGTPLNDAVETRAIKQVFGEHAYRLVINSTKSMIGHTMGGAGAIEAIVTALSLQEGVMHPTANLETPDPECDLDYIPGGVRCLEARVALKNAFGFGGQNACLVLRKWEN